MWLFDKLCCYQRRKKIHHVESFLQDAKEWQTCRIERMIWNYSNKIDSQYNIIPKWKLWITLRDHNDNVYDIGENKFSHCKPLYYADVHIKNGKIVSVHSGTRPRKAILNIFFPNEISDIITEYAALLPIFKK